MIIVLQSGLAESQITRLKEQLKQLGLSSQHAVSSGQDLIVINDDVSSLPAHTFTCLDGVEKIVRLHPPYPIAATINKYSFLQGSFGLARENGMPAIAAGPCSVEGEGQIVRLAKQVKEAGATLLRGGAFKPRTSPYDFRGLGLEGLKYLKQASYETGLPIVSEVMSAEQVEQAAPYIDIFQIGARNMYNYELLKELGRSKYPVLLKRAWSATITEFLQSAEYILLEGNAAVILCERGIRTFESHTRNTLDLGAVAALKSMTQLPIFVDPSHGTGRPELIRPMSRAAIACGADGLLIEVHDQPSKALSDGSQAITPNVLKEIVADTKTIINAFATQEITESLPQLLELGV